VRRHGQLFRGCRAAVLLQDDRKRRQFEAVLLAGGARVCPLPLQDLAKCITDEAQSLQFVFSEPSMLTNPAFAMFVKNIDEFKWNVKLYSYFYLLTYVSQPATSQDRLNYFKLDNPYLKETLHRDHQRVHGQAMRQHFAFKASGSTKRPRIGLNWRDVSNAGDDVKVVSVQRKPIIRRGKANPAPTVSNTVVIDLVKDDEETTSKVIYVPDSSDDESVVSVDGTTDDSVPRPKIVVKDESIDEEVGKHESIAAATQTVVSPLAVSLNLGQDEREKVASSVHIKKEALERPFVPPAPTVGVSKTSPEIVYISDDDDDVVMNVEAEPTYMKHIAASINAPPPAPVLPSGDRISSASQRLSPLNGEGLKTSPESVVAPEASASGISIIIDRNETVETPPCPNNVEWRLQAEPVQTKTSAKAATDAQSQKAKKTSSEIKEVVRKTQQELFRAAVTSLKRRQLHYNNRLDVDGRRGRTVGYRSSDQRKEASSRGRTAAAYMKGGGLFSAELFVADVKHMINDVKKTSQLATAVEFLKSYVSYSCVLPAVSNSESHTNR